jgi:hypothetical protein
VYRCGNVQLGTAAGSFEFGHTAFLNQLGPLLADGGFGFVGSVRRSVKQHHAATRLCRNLRNAAPHGASADDADGRENGSGVLCHGVQYSAGCKCFILNFRLSFIRLFVDLSFRLHDSLLHDLADTVFTTK